jgi:hypothetical protein
MICKNITLYGGEFLKDLEDFFDIDIKYQYVIDTWKTLKKYKKNDQFKYLQNMTKNEKIRYENILWRKWYMKNNNKDVINFDMDIYPRSKLQGRIVIAN